MIEPKLNLSPETLCLKTCFGAVEFAICDSVNSIEPLTGITMDQMFIEMFDKLLSDAKLEFLMSLKKCLYEKI